MERTTSRLSAPETAVFVALLAYTAGFVLFPPRVFLVVDEAQYVSQAMAFAQGALRIPGAGIVVPADTSRVISNYPPGTSLLQAPLVWLAGWRAAAVLSLASLAAATILMRTWLRDLGAPAGFALLVPAYLGSMLFGRIAMSDMPSCAIITLALWSLWRASSGNTMWSFLAGAAAGLSLLLREPNVVVLAPFFVGAILRRRVAVIPVVIGGLAGAAARLCVSLAVFGNALYVRDAGYGFSLGAVSHNAPMYAVILLVFFPAGLALPFLYHGPRRAEAVVAFVAYVAVFLFYDFDTIRQNGAVKGLVLSTRFLLELVPVLTMMAAHVAPRVYGTLPIVHQRLARGGAILFAAAVVAAAFGIHPLVRSQEREPVALVRVMHRYTSTRAPIITNHDATLKYFAPPYGSRQLILRDRVAVREVSALLQRFGHLSLVLLDRTDSELFRVDAAANDAYLRDISQRCSLTGLFDQHYGNSLRLRVFDIVGCA